MRSPSAGARSAPGFSGFQSQPWSLLGALRSQPTAFRSPILPESFRKDLSRPGDALFGTALRSRGKPRCRSWRGSRESGYSEGSGSGYWSYGFESIVAISEIFNYRRLFTRHRTRLDPEPL